jgi:CheY-like chemotaxis protein
MLVDGDRKPRVLVVEDDGFFTRMVKDALAPMDLDAVYVTTVEAALESARERMPELVLADYLLPGRDGLELLAEIGVLRGQPKRVLLTARSAVPSLWGQDIPVLFKPFKTATLQRLVAELLAPQESRAA